MHGLGETLYWFLYLFAELAVLFLFVSFLVGVIQEYVSPARIQAALSGDKRGSLVGAGFGAVTPFCSCSTIPLMVGMLNAGARFGSTMSFLLASPLVNPIILGLFLLAFGWEVTLAYAVLAFLLAVLLGIGGERSGLERHLRSVRVVGNKQKEEAGDEDVSFPARMKRIAGEAWQQFYSFLPYILGGVAIGAGIYGFVPQEWIASVAGEGNAWAVPVAAVVGIPLYIRVETMVPIALALLEKGMGLGPVMALVIGGSGCSIPEVSMLAKIFRPKLLIAFILSVLGIAVFAGFLFNLV